MRVQLARQVGCSRRQRRKLYASGDVVPGRYVVPLRRRRLEQHLPQLL